MISNELARKKVLTAGIVSLILMLGLARFSYTPLLPLMQAQANLSLAFGGYLAGINYVGYLFGAIAASFMSDLRLKDAFFRVGLILAVITTAMMGLAENIWLWSISRFVAGFSSAMGLLVGSGLVMHWLIRHEFKLELGLHFTGMGLGIVLCSVFVMTFEPILDWQAQWAWFTLIGAVLALWAWRWLPRPGKAHQTISGNVIEDKPPGRLFLRLFMLAYFCAGVGYVVSATFIVSIVDAAGISGNLAFLMIGLGALPAMLVWDVIARRISVMDALVVAYVLNLLAIALSIVANNFFIVVISNLLFGFSFFGVVGLVLTVAGRYYPTRPAKMMAKMTIAYGVAQITAPMVIGWFAGGMDGYLFGLYFALGAMLLGTIVMLLVRKLE